MNIALLERLDLPTLEKLCLVLFDQMGFAAESTGTGAMPGISDAIVLYGKANNAPFALLQCAVAEARVDVVQLSQIKKSMTARSLANSYLVNLGITGRGVHEFAAANKINLVDGTKFLELINNLPESGRLMLRETLASGRLPRQLRQLESSSRPKPTESDGGHICCAKCGTAMRLEVKMKGPHETGKFWQCSRAGCGYIRAYRQA